jgi:hypothetical protein
VASLPVENNTIHGRRTGLPSPGDNRRHRKDNRHGKCAVLDGIAGHGAVAHDYAVPQGYPYKVYRGNLAIEGPVELQTALSIADVALSPEAAPLRLVHASAQSLAVQGVRSAAQPNRPIGTRTAEPRTLHRVPSILCFSHHVRVPERDKPPR